MNNLGKNILTIIVVSLFCLFQGINIKATQDYSKLGMKLTEETMNAMFKGKEIENIVKTLGQPSRKITKSDYERWYFKRGVEIDVVNQNDSCKMLFNYVYINHSSDLKTNRKIKIGSLKNEVFKLYKNEINTAISDDKLIFAGTKDSGLIFQVENGKVYAIFIATGCGTMDNGEFPNR